MADAQPAAARVPSFRIVDSVRIDTKKDELMGELHMALRPDGSIVIAARWPQLVYFDSTGRRRWARSLGRDLRRIHAIGWLGDSLFIVDNSSAQVLSIGSNGGVASGSIELPDIVRPKWKDRQKMPAYGAIDVMVATEDGQLIGTPRGRAPVGVYGSSVAKDPTRVPVVRIDADGVVQHVLGMVENTAKGDRWFVLPDGRLMVFRNVGDSLAFTGISPTGDTLFARRLPKVKAVMSMTGGPDGTIWVSATDAAVKGLVHMAFDARGVVMGRIELPPGIRVGAGDAQHLWVFGTQGQYRTVARYTVRR